jgi:hypothetical protein
MSIESSVGARPSAEAVGWRALSVVAVLFRDNLERELVGESRPRGVLDQLHTLLMNWIDREQVKAHLSAREAAMLAPPLGAWDERAISAVSWAVEGAGTLLWAVQAVPGIPPYDQMFELESVIPDMNVFQDPRPFLERLQLRAADEIERARDVAEVWHWRARTHELQKRSGLAPAPQNLQNALNRAIGAGAFAAAQSYDFPAFDKPYRELDVDELGFCSTLARERHHALNWLSGRSADWDDLRADT